MADGIQIRHVTARSQLCLVELRHRRYHLSYGARGVCDGKEGRPYIPTPILDCACGVPHEFKTLHIHVDGTGSALVSKAGWESIQSAGETGFSVVGHTATPPTIVLGKPGGREQTDFESRAYHPLTPMKETVPQGPSNLLQVGGIPNA